MTANLRKSTQVGRRPPPVRSWAALAGALLLYGCSTLERQGIEPPAAEPPAEAPKALSAETPETSERKRLIALFGGEYRWPKAENYLNEVLVRLAKASETPTQPYRVTILNSAVVNAFALPSGDLFVTRGLLALANDTSEVAAVMAHEIAHVSARHAYLARGAGEARGFDRPGGPRHPEPAKRRGSRGHSAMTIASFSRQQELDADSIGIAVTARAGYDAYGASRFLSSLARSTDLRASLIGQKGGQKPDILPPIPRRRNGSPQRCKRRGKSARRDWAMRAAPNIWLRSTAWLLATIRWTARSADANTASAPRIRLRGAGRLRA